MKKSIIGIIFAIGFPFTSCTSWTMDSYLSKYRGNNRTFEMTTGKYKENKRKEYTLDLFADSTFQFGERDYFKYLKSGSGTWHDRNEYIILDFNKFDTDKERRELQERLTNISILKSMCMVLKKKGRNKLVIYPSKAVLKRMN